MQRGQINWFVQVYAYKDFISEYLASMREDMGGVLVQTVRFKDLAAYVVRQYPNSKSQDEAFLSKFLDITFRPTSEEAKAMNVLSNSYGPDFLEAREHQTVVSNYKKIQIQNYETWVRPGIFSSCSTQITSNISSPLLTPM